MWAMWAVTLRSTLACILSFAFIEMEYVQGETLAQTLSGGPLTEVRAIEIGLQIAEGLVAAHQAGLVHTDLNPNNINADS